jgi:hypothetical protein
MDAKKMLVEQIDFLENQMDLNMDKMAQYQDSIQALKDENKRHIESIRKIADKLKEIK